jgi:hypothetical protein
MGSMVSCPLQKIRYIYTTIVKGLGLVFNLPLHTTTTHATCSFLTLVAPTEASFAPFNLTQGAAQQQTKPYYLQRMQSLSY